MLYSNYSKRYEVSSIVGDEITFTEDHAYENGSPVEFVVDSGSTLPTACTDTINMWAIKTGARTIKVTLQHDDAVAGTKARSLSSGAGGSGTLYVWHGSGSGAYLSSGAHDNTFVGNRCEQNSSHGIHLNNAYGNVFNGNLLNVNQFDPYNNVPLATPYAAGIYLRNGSKENGIFGNQMSDWTPTYPQKYGVWIDDNCGRNYLGQNTYFHRSLMTDTMVSSVGNSTQIAVVNELTGATLTSDATASPLKLVRTDINKQWEFQLSTDVLRLINSTAGVTGIDLNSTSSSTTLTVGRNGYAGPVRASLIQGDQPNNTASADSAGADFYVIASNGTGSSTTGGAIRFYTPAVGASGTTPQTATERVNIPRDGGLIIRTKTSAPVNGLNDGHIYPNSSNSFFYGRLGSAWHTMSTPNILGLSTVVNDANATFTFFPLINRWNQLLNVPITADRTVTLSTSFAQQGTEATFIRSAASTGAFNWSIGGLINLTPGSWCTVVYDGSAWVLGTFTTSGGTLTDGDKGDITVGSSGSSFTIDNAAVTYAKMQNVSAASKLLGRGDSGSGSPQEITIGSGLTMTGTTLSSSGGGGTGANPTASVGLSTVNGVATTFLRSDGAPALDVSIAPTWTGTHTFSKNGALSLPTFSVTGTPITGGTATTTKPLTLIETAGATSTAWSTSGTMLGINAPSGFAGRMLDVHLNGISYMSLTSGGTFSVAGPVSSGGNVVGGAAQNLSWFGRSEMLSPSDGVILLQNAANSDFTRLQLGGTSTSFPALGRSGTTLAVQFADGTAGGKLSVGTTQSKVGGTIDQKFTSTGTPASSTETDLHSFTTVASSLGADGDGFTMTSGGTFAGNASATSQLRVYFGGTQIFASGALTAAAAGSWQIETMIIRDSSTSVRAITTLTTANAITVPLVTQTDVTGLTLSNSNILKVTGQGGGASPAVNDIIYKLGRIRFEPVY